MWSGEVAQASTPVYRGNKGIDAAKLEEIKALYGFDKPPLERLLDDAQGLLRYSTSARASSTTRACGR
jgi:microcin C transport system permease protein